VETDGNATRIRLDKWLWATRLFKTRGLAAQDIGAGRVTVNGQLAKASREMRPGDLVRLRRGGLERELIVRAVSLIRGPAVVAQALYEETAESLTRRQLAEQARRLAPDPARAIEQGRPTKRDRREIERSQVQWQRWSASIDDDRG
jgi:ribosome-associated heat shock protein Hsp15